jgi:hypothetical protein
MLLFGPMGNRRVICSVSMDPLSSRFSVALFSNAGLNHAAPGWLRVNLRAEFNDNSAF